MQQLFLKKHEDRRLRAGHLWIFSNEVDVKRSPLTAFAPGEAAQVCAADGRTIGTAYVNPASLIAARIVSRKADEPLDAALIKKRLERALQLRETLFDVPFYRLCHGEGDWLPGLVLDRYGDVFSAQITTAGMDAQKDALLGVLGELFTPKAVLHSYAMLTSAQASPAYQTVFAEVAGVDALDARTVRFRFKAPNRDLPLTVGVGLPQLSIDVQQLALVRYASHDIAGPLIVEGLWDLQQQQYQPQHGALWAQQHP